MKQRYLLLWGGVDISPHWYEEEPLPTTQKPDLIRDKDEFAAVDNAIDDCIPIIGVCRGAQLLCVANGGNLHQHVPYHKNNSHPIFTRDGKIFKNVAADHHQVMIPAGNYELYATSYDDYLPEVVYWPSTKSLAIQPHPEWMKRSDPFNVWLDDLIFNLFNLKGVF